MAKLSSFKNKPIKDISQVTIKLGILLHEEYCSEDSCDHCNGDVAKRGDIQEELAVTEFRELYELSNKYHLQSVAEGMEHQSRRKSKASKKGHRKGNDFFKPPPMQLNTMSAGYQIW